MWAPLSERIGRRYIFLILEFSFCVWVICIHLFFFFLLARWIYIIAMAIYTVCTIICGISTKLSVFFAFRVLQGIFGCAGQAVGGGSVSDIFEPHERGKAMGIYILG